RVLEECAEGRRCADRYGIDYRAPLPRGELQEIDSVHESVEACTLGVHGQLPRSTKPFEKLIHLSGGVQVIERVLGCASLASCHEVLWWFAVPCTGDPVARPSGPGTVREAWEMETVGNVVDPVVDPDGGAACLTAYDRPRGSG